MDQSYRRPIYISLTRSSMSTQSSRAKSQTTNFNFTWLLVCIASSPWEYNDWQLNNWHRFCYVSCASSRGWWQYHGKGWTCHPSPHISTHRHLSTISLVYYHHERVRGHGGRRLFIDIQRVRLASPIFTIHWCPYYHLHLAIPITTSQSPSSTRWTREAKINWGEVQQPIFKTLNLKHNHGDTTPPLRNLRD